MTQVVKFYNILEQFENFDGNKSIEGLKLFHLMALHQVDRILDSI